MCGPMEIGAAIGGGASLLGMREDDKQLGRQIAAQQAQKTNMVKSLNYEVANLSQEQRDQFDQALAQLQSNSIDSIRNQGMIEAALGETNLQGRTTDAVIREVQGQTSRVKDSIKDSYQKSWTGLQQNKEAAIMETQGALDGMPKLKGPSTFQRILSVTSGALQGATMGQSAGAAYKAAGGLPGIKASVGLGGKTGANTGLKSR